MDQTFEDTKGWLNFLSPTDLACRIIIGPLRLRENQKRVRVSLELANQESCELGMRIY